MVQGEGSYIKKGVGHAIFSQTEGVGRDIYNLMVEIISLAQEQKESV